MPAWRACRVRVLLWGRPTVARPPSANVPVSYCTLQRLDFHSEHLPVCRRLRVDTCCDKQEEYIRIFLWLHTLKLGDSGPDVAFSLALINRVNFHHSIRKGQLLPPSSLNLQQPAAAGLEVTCRPSTEEFPLILRSSSIVGLFYLI